MRYLDWLRNAVAATGLSLALVSCGQSTAPSEQPAETSVEAAAPTISLGRHVRVEGFNTQLERAGDVYSARRNGAGNQGISIQPRADSGPVLITFTVQGAHTRLRVRQNDVVGRLPIQDSNSVMIGPGGASSVTAFSADAEVVSVTITGLTECGSAPAGTCTPASIVTGN